MTGPAATIPTPEADLRWRQWQARGAADDRRTARRMGTAMVLMAIGFVIWLLVLIL
jgi:hypothetical protein